MPARLLLLEAFANELMQGRLVEIFAALACAFFPGAPLGAAAKEAARQKP